MKAAASSPKVRHRRSPARPPAAPGAISHRSWALPYRVDLARCTQAGLDRALYPRVMQRRVLAREVDATLRRDDVRIQQRLLRRLEQRERATGVWIVVPHLRRADLELFLDLRMDDGDVLQRLHDALVRRQ